MLCTVLAFDRWHSKPSAHSLVILLLSYALFGTYYAHTGPREKCLNSYKQQVTNRKEEKVNQSPDAKIRTGCAIYRREREAVKRGPRICYTLLQEMPTRSGKFRQMVSAFCVYIFFETYAFKTVLRSFSRSAHKRRYHNTPTPITPSLIHIYTLPNLYFLMFCVFFSFFFKFILPLLSPHINKFWKRVRILFSRCQIPGTKRPLCHHLPNSRQKKKKNLVEQNLTT